MPFVFTSLVCILIVVVMVCELDQIPARDKWPPITDDDFIRRCSPGVDRERALTVRRIISEQLGVEYARVYPEQRFVQDLGCD